jgi:ElaB/YqjD/DUF883 family membrane-anchored ribosome-binding protein
MKFIQFLSFLMFSALVCGTIAFTNVVPAIASTSNLDAGMKQLPNIQTRADQAVKDTPYDSVEKSNRGLNEIQGTADFDKMKHDYKGEGIPAASQTEKVVKKVENKIDSAKDDTKNGINSAMDQAGNVVKKVTDNVVDTAKSIKDKIKS